MREAFRIGLLLVGVWLSVSCVSTMTNHHGHKIFNPLYLFYLESPSRDRWQMPDQVLDALRIEEGDVVADVGAGGGYFTEKISRRVGSTGRVYATDVQKVMIRKLTQRVHKRDLTNVTVIHATFDDPGLPSGSCDLVFFSSVYKEISGREQYLRRVRQALRPDGRLAILEYRPEAKAIGPPRRYRLSETQITAEAEAAGFRLLERFDFLPRESFLVFGPANPD